MTLMFEMPSLIQHSARSLLAWLSFASAIRAHSSAEGSTFSLVSTTFWRYFLKSAPCSSSASSFRIRHTLHFLSSFRLLTRPNTSRTESSAPRRSKSSMQMTVPYRCKPHGHDAAQVIVQDGRLQCARRDPSSPSDNCVDRVGLHALEGGCLTYVGGVDGVLEYGVFEDIPRT
jgi:hypothetical protein